ncbi:MAG: pilin [Candidatus Gracilibacteria bacterium]|jgi:uncharacterized membrane protein
MKKIALIIITAFILNFTASIFATVAYANDPEDTQAAETTPAPAVTPTPGSISDPGLTFNVKDYLKLEGADQVYFQEGSPIVALITRVIEFATYIIGSIAVILVIIAGFMFMVSQGNQQKLDEAKEIFKYAVIGLIIVFLSYIITIFAQSIFAAK